jgi:hypothetical protein
MQNLRIYLPILIGLTIFLVVVFALVQNKKRYRKLPLVSSKEQAAYEEFHCIKSSMKQVNQDITIAQLVFTNRLDVTLDARPKVPRQISED